MPGTFLAVLGMNTGMIHQKLLQYHASKLKILMFLTWSVLNFYTGLAGF